MFVSRSPRFDSLVRLSRDRGATHAERALAASHVARLCDREGIDVLTIYPFGLPE